MNIKTVKSEISNVVDSICTCNTQINFWSNRTIWDQFADQKHIEKQIQQLEKKIKFLNRKSVILHNLLKVKTGRRR